MTNLAFFQVVQLRQEVVGLTNVWSIDSKWKGKNWYIALQVYFKHLKNNSFLSKISLF